MKPTNKQYEFIRIEFVDDLDLIENLNKYGASGWRPVFTKEVKIGERYVGTRQTFNYVVLERELVP